MSCASQNEKSVTLDDRKINLLKLIDKISESAKMNSYFLYKEKKNKFFTTLDRLHKQLFDNEFSLNIFQDNEFQENFFRIGLRIFGLSFSFSLTLQNLNKYKGGFDFDTHYSYLSLDVPLMSFYLSFDNHFCPLDEE